MPKFIVTSGSTFQPFTYDQLVKPIQQMAEAHNVTQDAYDQISLETNALRNYITDNPEDAQAKAMYDSYMDKLTNLQNNLWSNGYNAQTRRDLAAARAGYASDITRLGTAIKARQERSAEYWKTKHAHPDMIMGSDPGLSGLDAYLNDDTYGQNYFSYSGNQFAAEVGTDAKARAAELLRNPEISKDPRLVGYLTRIIQQGFTNGEVDAAYNAVASAIGTDPTNLDRIDQNTFNSLDPITKILADTFSEHLRSTGAAGNVSPEEFGRLMGYGRTGLSQAVTGPQFRDFEDKQWAQDQAWKMWQRQQNYKAAQSSGSGAQTPGGNYTFQDLSTFMKTQNANKTFQDVNKHFVKPFENGPVVTSDGTVIASPMDAERILSGFGRDAIMTRFGGIDPLHPTLGTGKMIAGPNESVEVRVVERNYEDINDFDSSVPQIGFVVQVRDGRKWKDSTPLTEEFNEKYDAFNAQKTAWEQTNPEASLDKLAISEKERKKLYANNNIPNEVPIEFAPYVAAAQSRAGDATPATIADSTEYMDGTRENYARLMQDSFSRAPKNRGKVAKDSKYAFYPLENYNDYDIPEKGITDIKDVFGTTKVDGKEVISYNGLQSVVAFPEDVATNKIRVRIKDHWYAVDPAMLGNNMDAQVQKLRQPVVANGQLLDEHGYIHYAMLPMMDPARALQMSESESYAWASIVQNLLGQYLNLGNGDGSYITPADIVMNGPLQGALRTAVTHFMNNVLAEPRDDMGQNHFQETGKTSTKASGYNDYIGY